MFARSLTALLLLSSLLVAFAGSASAHASGVKVERHAARNARLSKRGEGGWGLVEQANGTRTSNIPVRGGQYELYAWTRDNVTEDAYKNLKRIVFTTHGMGRDPWNYLLHTQIALTAAVDAGLPVQDGEMGLWAPSYWNQMDDPVANRTDTNWLFWYRNEWEDGHNSILPEGSSVSSFEVLDNVLAYFGNRTIFPNVDSIVLASHSMGAQMMQRYALLGNMPDIEPEVHFVVGNPGAYLYIDDQRPVGAGGAMPLDNCSDWNAYKFGLNKVSDELTYGVPIPNKDLLWQRYQQRNVHYMIGQLDDGRGANISCPAYVQGDAHRTRGALFHAYLEHLGGFPASHTLDYVDCTHDDQCVFSSPQGQQRLFLQSKKAGQDMPSYIPQGPYNNLFQGPVQFATSDGEASRMPDGTAFVPTSFRATNSASPGDSKGSTGSQGNASGKSSGALSSVSADPFFSTMAALALVTLASLTTL
ncbi:hypothetical protein IE81DRAFT_319564 [Ceraceosorus guamensis]|uniref:Alpha/beta-hydrolase n=1 Tax=Ceraceosorus guamensis TaxID=1522189 RepID=A0A316WG48_9BASI|nr:hypothetical protein IE81DRAFT_319564 [Ceraceosorus guamensis]PWN46175.1 hypothetical protein IE81DRAFT_319564 [Ceraceosorus guamensis]